MLVRSVLETAGDWTAQQAVDLLAQGYSVERVVVVTGFDARWVRYQADRLDPVGRDDANDVGD